MITRAAILNELNKPLIVDNIEIPEKLEYGQVLVKIQYSGICGSQIGEISGAKGPDKYLPHLLGHEGGGVVVKVGEGVTFVKPGDRVVLHWRPGKGISSSTPKYLWKSKPLNAGWVTTFNEHAIISENRLTVLPDHVDLKTATLYGCALTTAYGVITNDASVKSGESVVIFGAGGVGMSIVQMAALAGANPIIVADINDYKLKHALHFGATHTINSLHEDPAKKIPQLLQKGADVVIDTTGIKSLMELSYELTHSTGRTILVGVPKVEDKKITIDSMPLHFGKKITGSHGGDSEPFVDIPRLALLQAAGKLDVKSLITHEYKLDQINEAIEMLKKGDALRIVIKMHD